MSTLESLTVLCTLLAALSAASERLVEIIKGIVPALSKKHEPDSDQERHRALAIHLLAIASGVVTALLAKQALTGEFRSLFADESSTGTLQFVALGLLSGAGSSFWSSIVKYLLAVKQLRADAADNAALAKLNRADAVVPRNHVGELTPGHT